MHIVKEYDIKLLPRCSQIFDYFAPIDWDILSNQNHESACNYMFHIANRYLDFAPRE